MNRIPLQMTPSAPLAPIAPTRLHRIASAALPSLLEKTVWLGLMVGIAVTLAHYAGVTGLPFQA